MPTKKPVQHTSHPVAHPAAGVPPPTPNPGKTVPISSTTAAATAASSSTPAPSTTASTVVLSTTPPVLVIPVAPVTFVPEDMKTFRGFFAKTAQVAAAPDVAVELSGSNAYTQTFGALAPEVSGFVQLLQNGVTWTNIRAGFEAYLVYVKVQEAITWKAALTDIEQVKAVYDVAIQQNAQLPKTFPALTRLIDATSTIAKKAAATRKRKATALATDTSSAAARTATTTPASASTTNAAPSATSPSTPTATPTPGGASH